MDSRVAARAALEMAGIVLTGIAPMIPHERAAAGVRLGAALIGGVGDALDQGRDAKELLEAIRQEPLSDMWDSADSQDAEIEAYIKRRFK